MNQATKNQLDVQDLKGKYSNRAGGGWGGGSGRKRSLKNHHNGTLSDASS